MAAAPDVTPDRWVQRWRSWGVSQRPARRIILEEIQRDAFAATARTKQDYVPEVPVLADSVQAVGEDQVRIIGHLDDLKSRRER